MSTLSSCMLENLKAAVAGQAERAGVSLNRYLLTIVGAHGGSQAESERCFAARAAHSSPGRALEVLARAGQGNPPEPGDELPPDLTPDRI